MEVQGNQRTAGEMEFRIGSIISRAFSVIFGNPIVFFGLALLSLLPAMIFGMATGAQEENPIFLAANFIFSLMISGAVAYAVFQSFRGEKATIGKSLVRGMSCIFSLFGLCILIGICFFAAALLLVFGLGLFASAGAVVIGMLFPVLFLILMLVLICKWAVTVQACAVERLGPIDGLRRSSILTTGHRLKIFGLLIVIFLIQVIITLVPGYVIGLLVRDAPSISILLGQLVLVLPQAFQTVAIAIAYYDLRAVKEGIAVDALANVFD